MVDFIIINDANDDDDVMDDFPCSDLPHTISQFV